MSQSETVTPVEPPTPPEHVQPKLLVDLFDIWKSARKRDPAKLAESLIGTINRVQEDFGGLYAMGAAYEGLSLPGVQFESGDNTFRFDITIPGGGAGHVEIGVEDLTGEDRSKFTRYSADFGVKDGSKSDNFKCKVAVDVASNKSTKLAECTIESYQELGGTDGRPPNLFEIDETVNEVYVYAVMKSRPRDIEKPRK